MELLVCIKQVPDTSEIKLDPETNNLIRTGLPSIVNPYDMHALEAALAVKDQYEGSRVTVITMGPPQAEDALRQCLALGADCIRYSSHSTNHESSISNYFLWQTSY